MRGMRAAWPAVAVALIFLAPGGASAVAECAVEEYERIALYSPKGYWASERLDIERDIGMVVVFQVENPGAGFELAPRPIYHFCVTLACVRGPDLDIAFYDSSGGLSAAFDTHPYIEEGTIPTDAAFAVVRMTGPTAYVYDGHDTLFVYREACPWWE